MVERNSSESPDFISETPGPDPLSDVLRSLRLRARIFRQGTYCGAWTLDSPEGGQTIFHLIGRGQAWLHREGAREPEMVGGGDLVMFPRGNRHQLSGMPRRVRGTRMTPADQGPFTTVLCAIVEFDAA